MRIEKLAINMGGEEANFERSLSNLAHAYLQDRIPKVADYELGFQIIDKADDNTKAVGIMAIQIGQHLVYIPIFFLNGELKGYDLAWLAKDDLFLPATEKWFDYLIRQRSSVLGEPIDTAIRSRGVDQPWLTQLRLPPNTKAGSYKPNRPPWLLDRKLFRTVGKYQKQALAVPSLLIRDPDSAYCFLRTIDQYPVLLKPIVECYGKSIVKQAEATIKRIRKANIKTAGKFDREYWERFTGRKSRMLDVKVYIDNGERPEELTSKEAAELRERGLYIKDNRPDASRVYSAQQPIELGTATETGLYDVLIGPDEFAQCVVLKNPYGGFGRQRKNLVIDTEPKNGSYRCNLAWSDSIYQIHAYDKSDFEEWFEALPEKESLTRDAVYAVITPSGDSAGPFRVLGTDASVGEERCYRIEPVCSRNVRNSHVPFDEPNYYTLDRISQSAPLRLVFNGIKGRNIRLQSHTLYLPPGSKAIELSLDERPDGTTECTLPLGENAAFQAAIYKHASVLRIANDGVETIIDGKHYTPKSALVHLVCDHGIRVGTARKMLAKAAASRGAYTKFMIKYAQPYPLQQSSVYAPAIPEPPMGMETGMTQSWPVQGPVEATIPYGPTMGAQQQSQVPPAWSPPEPPVGIGNQIMQAMRTGQKEVLDTSILANLLNATRDETLVDQYLPKLIRGLDSIGRLLFNLYWHREQFEDRFGDELPTLEDALRNTFDQLGKLVLELKEKAVAADPLESYTASLESMTSSNQ